MSFLIVFFLFLLTHRWYNTTIRIHFVYWTREKKKQIFVVFWRRFSSSLKDLSFMWNDVPVWCPVQGHQCLPSKDKLVHSPPPEDLPIYCDVLECHYALLTTMKCIQIDLILSLISKYPQKNTPKMHKDAFINIYHTIN